MSFQNHNTTGSLYIVATPIGNLQDITLRAISTLKSVDLILAEDTRHANILLQNYQINTPLESFHAHNEQKKSEGYFNMLLQGSQLALISDAGTPLINDPGFPLVQLARKHQIPVIPIPGPCALICALSAAGVPTDHFSFHGFPPAKKSARQKFFQNCLQQHFHTLVFYESTHRIQESLQDLAGFVAKDSPVIIAKELSKSYEQFVQGDIEHLLEWFDEDHNRLKGEFVIIIPPRPQTNLHQKDIENTLKLLLSELPTKKAVNLCQKITGESKNYLYDLAIALQKV